MIPINKCFSARILRRFYNHAFCLAGITEEGEDSAAAMENAYKWILRWGVGLAILLFILWPLLALPAKVFSKGYFTFCALHFPRLFPAPRLVPACPAAICLALFFWPDFLLLSVCRFLLLFSLFTRFAGAAAPHGGHLC